MRTFSNLSIFSFILVLLFCLFILPTALFSQEDEGGPEEEEEPVQAYPNPLENKISDAKAMQLMKTQLENMGFTVGKIQKVADGKFSVSVQSWDQAKMKPRFKDSVGISQTRIKANRGVGKVAVTVDKTGIYFDNRSFKAMGLKMNAAKLKQAAIVK
jgi:hypothetical protein